jgi:hypothetical protein
LSRREPDCYARQGAADRGEYREAAVAFAPEVRKLSGAAAKKIKPQFSALFGFLLLTLAFI